MSLHKRSEGQFKARLTLEEGGDTEMTVWDDELSPTTTSRRPTREWAAEHLQNYDQADLRELLGVPQTGHLEVLLTAKIVGWFSGYESPEWDEELNVQDCQHQVLPADWFEAPDLDRQLRESLDEDPR